MIIKLKFLTCSKLLQNQFWPQMKRNLLLAGLSFLLFTISEAQGYDYPSPATTSLGLSGASDTTVWSLYSNPSGLTSILQPAGGVGYHNAFGIQALSARTAFVTIPTKYLSTGISYVQYGDKLYNFQSFSFSAARTISPRLKMGIRFQYLIRHIYGTDNQNTFVVDAGLSYNASDQVRIALFSRNPAGATLPDDYNVQKLPSSLAAACIVRLSPVFFLTADLMHREDLSRQQYAFALSARVLRCASIRGAISARPVRLAVGSTLGWQGLEINFSANYHDLLGLSSTAGISYAFGLSRGDTH